jgi:nucleoid-associated protein YgaU
MGYHRPTTGKLPRPLGLWFSAFLCLVSLSASYRVSAQDVAEAARQEKARKAAQGKPKSKVYTDEDLKQPQILTPEDRARAQSGKKDPVYSPNQLPPQSVDAINDPPSESLGEIARRYRREKAARQAEEAAKSQSPFKMELPKAALAAPVLPRVAPAMPPASSRRDPFSRALVSAAPHGAVSGVAPAAAVPVTVAPRVASPLVPNSAPKSELAGSLKTGTVVTIQSGDSLWKLARQYLGRGSRWHELLAVNPGLPDPNLIQPGKVLVIPQTMAGKHPGLPSSILVKKGDSLWRIAEAQFGHGGQWLCLARANPQIHDFDHIEPGQALTIPATCGLTP